MNNDGIFHNIIIYIIVFLSFFIIVIGLITKYSIIYGILITGKDDRRIHLASLAVSNFFEQDYKGDKKLIIINHHPKLSVKIPEEYKNHVKQVFVSKHNRTLGHLRNIGLSYVPKNALWITWDDDDFRERRFLSKLYKQLNKQDAVSFDRRYEYNVLTDSVWKTYLKKGFVHMLCRKNDTFKFLDKDAMEDVNLYRDLKISVYKVKPNEWMYIRLVHDDNTSLYVDPKKKTVAQIDFQNQDYLEIPVSLEEKKYVVGLMSKYKDHLLIGT